MPTETRRWSHIRLRYHHSKNCAGGSKSSSTNPTNRWQEKGRCVHTIPCTCYSLKYFKTIKWICNRCVVQKRHEKFRVYSCKECLLRNEIKLIHLGIEQTHARIELSKDMSVRLLLVALQHSRRGDLKILRRIFFYLPTEKFHCAKRFIHLKTSWLRTFLIWSECEMTTQQKLQIAYHSFQETQF